MDPGSTVNDQIQNPITGNHASSSRYIIRAPIATNLVGQKHQCNYRTKLAGQTVEGPSLEEACVENAERATGGLLDWMFFPANNVVATEDPMGLLRPSGLSSTGSLGGIFQVLRMGYLGRFLYHCPLTSHSGSAHPKPLEATRNSICWFYYNYNRTPYLLLRPAFLARITHGLSKSRILSRCHGPALHLMFCVATAILNHSTYRPLQDGRWPISSKIQSWV